MKLIPEYSFRILDDRGWNFREAKYHEENRRTLYKLYGIKVSLVILVRSTLAMCFAYNILIKEQKTFQCRSWF